MFTPTANPYRFKYLVTGISGPGIKEVYLPPWPDDSEFLFKKEQKFVKPRPSEELQAWMDELVYERNRKNSKGEYLHPDYIHPHQNEINEWEDQEWDRATNGIFFWRSGKKCYITGAYYKFLTAWDPGFEVEFRTPHMEIFYWIKFWEEDQHSYGGNLNTIRRGGKSSIMGFWIMNRTSTNPDHRAGMQGEDDTKIRDFYNTHVIEPFYRLPYYFQPEYDTTTLQKKGILFSESPRRHRRRMTGKKVLRSKMDYRTSEENKYDQAKLHSFAHEELGKCLSADVHKRYGFIKPCLMQGKFIIGKHFGGTTVEFMNTSGKGGRAYKKLCFESDYDIRNKNGETISGLYSALLPGDCAVEGFYDEFGDPDRKAAREWILNNREAVKNSPADYATLVRKYPLSWTEVFYTSAEHCEFNIQILQDRKAELLMAAPPVRRFNLDWMNKVRFSSIVMEDSDTGWFKTTKVFSGEEAQWYNQVSRRMEMRFNAKTGSTELMQLYAPMNDEKFAIGLDPIDHGVVVEDMSTMGADGFVSARKSRPVMLVKRKYDSSVDGPLSLELMIQRARERYPYKTGVQFAMMDQRPQDPNILFERCLMICWLLGCSVSVESQKPGVINWFNEAGCGDFIWMKYVADPAAAKKADMIQGTSASTPMIQEYTGLIATDVEYFGHTYPFIEVVEDDLLFRPDKTREFDYAVAQGWMEIGARMRRKIIRPKMRDIGEYFKRFAPDGSIIRSRK